jgi:hypothetical protein
MSILNSLGTLSQTEFPDWDNMMKGMTACNDHLKTRPKETTRYHDQCEMVLVLLIPVPCRLTRSLLPLAPCLKRSVITCSRRSPYV